MCMSTCTHTGREIVVVVVWGWFCLVFTCRMLLCMLWNIVKTFPREVFAREDISTHLTLSNSCTARMCQNVLCYCPIALISRAGRTVLAHAHLCPSQVLCRQILRTGITRVKNMHILNCEHGCQTGISRTLPMLRLTVCIWDDPFLHHVNSR